MLLLTYLSRSFYLSVLKCLVTNVVYFIYYILTLWKIYSSSASIISCLLKIHLSHLLFIQSLPHNLSKERRYRNRESFSKCQAYVVCIVLQVYIIWTLPFDVLTDNITFGVSECISCSSQDWLAARRASSLIFSIAFLDEIENENIDGNPLNYSERKIQLLVGCQCIINFEISC